MTTAPQIFHSLKRPSQASPAFQMEIIQARELLQRMRHEIAKALVGQTHLVDSLLVGLLTNGHILLEGVPGLAKTTAVKALARSLDSKFQRIQFTPDLLPADLVGNLIYNPQRGDYATKLGPIFANIVLADEINRAPAKVQSALLEAMQEHQVTLGEKTYPLPEPFLVLATENPVDQEGTYPLPEAQVDRFMLKVIVDYPSREEEMIIMRMMARSHPVTRVDPVLPASEVLRIRELVDGIYCDERVEEYMVSLVVATREIELHDPSLAGMVRFGASPRATINLALAARAHALLQGRAYVTPQDVKTMALDVLRHRVITTFEAVASGITPESIVQQLLGKILVP